MKKFLSVLSLLFIAFYLAGCTATVVNPNPTQWDPTATYIPTASPSPLPTVTDTPELTDTPAPTPTLLPTPTLVPTPSPTKGPTPSPSPSPRPVPGTIVSMQDATYAYEEMMEDIGLLMAKFPEYLTLRTIGQSVYGRDIPLIILGDPDNPKKILIQASSHGREYITSLLVMKQLEVYCEQYKTESYNGMTYEQIISECAIYFVPMSNPDGVNISIYGISSVPMEWRAWLQTLPGADNLKMWKANGAGVDLNQNFGTGWGDLSSLKTSPASENYPGPNPFSEPEAIALQTLCEENAFLSLTSYHACGRIIYWQYFQDAVTLNRDRQYATELKAITGYALVEEKDISTASVGLKDWFITRYHRPGFTIEVGKGSYGTPVPYKDLYNVWYKNELVPIHLAWRECT